MSKEVYKGCIEQGIKMQPKPTVSRVPLVSRDPEKVEAVFLDDEKAIIYRTNELLVKYHIKTLIYHDEESLLSANLSRDLLTFVDKDLGNTSGVDVAKKLKSMGYNNLLASTGHGKSSFTKEEKSFFQGYVWRGESVEEFRVIILKEKNRAGNLDKKRAALDNTKINTMSVFSGESQSCQITS